MSVTTHIHTHTHTLRERLFPLCLIILEKALFGPQLCVELAVLQRETPVSYQLPFPSILYISPLASLHLTPSSPLRSSVHICSSFTLHFPFSRPSLGRHSPVSMMWFSLTRPPFHRETEALVTVFHNLYMEGREISKRRLAAEWGSGSTVSSAVRMCCRCPLVVTLSAHPSKVTHNLWKKKHLI